MSTFERLRLPLVKEAGFSLNIEGSRDMLSLGLGLNAVLLTSTRIFNPRLLFSAGEEGVWFQPDAANEDWRRNLLTFTEQFDNAAWTKSRATISADAVTAPNGTLTADNLTQSAGQTIVGEVSVSFSWSTGAYTLSVYAKPNGKNFLRFVENGSVAAASAATWFNISAGTVGTTSANHTASITNVGSGWYRCVISFTSISSTLKTFAVTIQCADTNNTTTVVDSGGISIWGAQLELGSVATDYQRISDVSTELRERFPRVTTFTDTAGTTPAQVGQAVALMLDKSEGLVLGPELVTNGTFDGGSAAGWFNVGNNVAVSDSFVVDGALNVSITTVQNCATAIPTLQLNQTVEVTFQARRVTGSGVLLVRFSQNFSNNAVTAASFSSALSSSFQTFKVVFTNTGFTRNRIFFREDTGLGDVIAIDNISVRELPGNHATQSILASRPTLARVPASGRRNILTNTDSLSTQTVTVRAVSHVLSFFGTGTVTLSGASTAGPLVGTGANDRVHIAFTPTAGSLTLTVSGSVNFAQLEEA